MSNIADKISKLIAKADSSTHPEEASAFMAKVHQLLEAHGLNLLDLGRLQSDDPLGKHEKQAEFFASETALRDVVFRLARFYGCRAVIHQQDNHRWATIIGRESARITFELMWPYVKKTIRFEARRLAKESTTKTTYARQLRFVADALAERLLLEVYRRLETEKANETVTTGVNALVPVDLLQQMVDAQGAKVARDRETKTTPEARAAAANVSLNLQTTGAKQKQIA